MGNIGNTGMIEAEGRDGRVAVRLCIEALALQVERLARQQAQLVQNNTTVNNTINQTINNITGSASYLASFTALSTWTILGVIHGLQTTAITVTCYDDTGQWVLPNTITVNNVTRDVVVTWSTPQTGKAVLI